MSNAQPLTAFVEIKILLFDDFARKSGCFTTAVTDGRKQVKHKPRKAVWHSAHVAWPVTVSVNRAYIYAVRYVSAAGSNLL